jgi:hypothetical protein
MLDHNAAGRRQGGSSTASLNQEAITDTARSGGAEEVILSAQIGFFKPQVTPCLSFRISVYFL